MLPNVAPLIRPGSFGTFPETVEGSAPKAPTLDHGPLYTGEWREEVNGDPLIVQTTGVQTVLATLRRPWPFVGFAVDVSRLAAGDVVVAGLNVVTRSSRATLVGNVIQGGVLGSTAQLTFTIPATNPPAWIAMTGMILGVRPELWISLTRTGGAVKLRGDLWGYNSPGFGP